MTARQGGPRSRGEAGTYFGHHWLPELPLLPDSERPALPPTRPDEEAATHPWGHRCEVCRRPSAARYKRARLRGQTRSERGSEAASSG